VVRGAIVAEHGGLRSVSGVTIGAGRNDTRIDARVIIAADGRHSTIAFGLGLAAHPPRPRRWAIGAYFANFMPTLDPNAAPSFGEMHVRRGHYIGIAPVREGLTNVCVVKPSGAGDPALGDPTALLMQFLAADPLLRDRAARAELIGTPVVLGPLAVDVRAARIDGLLLAGDAAGFIDPMTGDGIRFATQGAELAAAAALGALEHGWAGVHDSLVAARRRAFSTKWTFNRGLRALVASPAGVNAAALGARIAPSLLRAVIARAGDC
jgi:flavin-dependent dehydrogenase